jgi:hypothetical protein
MSPLIWIQPANLGGLFFVRVLCFEGSGQEAAARRIAGMTSLLACIKQKPALAVKRKPVL